MSGCGLPVQDIGIQGCGLDPWLFGSGSCGGALSKCEVKDRPPRPPHWAGGIHPDLRTQAQEQPRTHAVASTRAWHQVFLAMLQL